MMREDFKKVLVESPRIGGGVRRKYREVRHKKRFAEEEMFPDNRKSMRRRYMILGIEKNFGEHLAPLYRYLRGQVGRKWDDVYSEIRAKNPSNSTVGNHIMCHLRGYVTLNKEIYLENGKYYEYNQTWRSDNLREVSGLFVDNEGILQENPRIGHHGRIRRNREETAEKLHGVKRIINKDLELHKEDGIWYAFTISTLPKNSFTYVPRGWWTPKEIQEWRLLSQEQKCLTGMRVCKFHLTVFEPPTPTPDVTYSAHRVSKDGERYYSGKRQLSTKELVKYHLSNG